MSRKEITVSDISSKNVAELIQLACLFNSEIILEGNQYRINAKSIMGVMAFHLTEGMTVSIVTTGNDEIEALSTIENFLCKDKNF